MKEYEKRMMKEYEELYKKVEKLRKFVSSDIFRCATEDEQKLLSRQLAYMQGYLYALEERLRARNLLQYTGPIRKIQEK